MTTTKYVKGAVLLTGANGGLGLGLARNFLEAGHRELAFQYRSSKEKLDALLKEFDLPAEKHVFQADLTKESDVKALRENVEKKIGAVGSVINLAGASTNGMSWKLTLEDFNKIIAANLTSAFLVCREFIPAMRNASTGRLVNVSSVVAFTGAPGAAHYSAAKAGLIGLTKSLALELANKNITVNALALGYFDRGLIDTVPAEIQTKIKEKIPANRFGTTREIFGALDFLLSEAGAYTTGQAMHLNGGLYF